MLIVFVLFFQIDRKLLTAADDTMMHAFQLGAEKCAPVATGEPLDLEDEIFTITSNQVDSIAVGGEEKKVYLHKLEENEDGTLKLAGTESKELAMCFDTPVMKLEYCAGGKLLGVS